MVEIQERDETPLSLAERRGGASPVAADDLVQVVPVARSPEAEAREAEREEAVHGGDRRLDACDLPLEVAQLRLGFREPTPPLSSMLRVRPSIVLPRSSNFLVYVRIVSPLSFSRHRQT